MSQSEIQKMSFEFINGLWAENYRGEIVEFTTEEFHEKFWIIANVADAIVDMCEAQINLYGYIVFDEIMLRQLNRVKRMVDNVTATAYVNNNKSISSVSEVINNE